VDLVRTWHTLLIGYQSRQLQEPVLARDCLKVLAKYIGWIDLDLVANEHFLTLFHQLLGDPQTRKECIGCLAALVAKGMPHQTKLELVQKLQLGQVLQAAESQDLENDEEMAMQVAQLVNVAGCQLVEGWGSLAEGSAASNEALAGVLQLLPQMLLFLKHEDTEVSELLFSFAAEYVDCLKKKGASAMAGPQGEAHLGFLRAMFQAVLKCIEYPDDYNFEAEEEYEAEFLEYRGLAIKLHRKIQLLVPELFTGLVTEAVQHALQNLSPPPQGLPFEAVEATMYALCVAGEAAHMQGVAHEWIQNLMAQILESRLSQHSHRSVLMIYHELVGRYIHVIQSRGGQYVIPIVEAILDHRGLHHPNAQVRGRTAYLFKTMAKRLREQPILYQHFETIMGSLQTHVQMPLPGVPANGTALDMEDRHQLYEVVAQLITTDHIPLEKQQEYLTSIVTPLVQQMEMLANNPRTQSEPMLTKHLCDVIEGCGYISKGCRNNATPSIAVFSKVLDVLVCDLSKFPQDYDLFKILIFFLHRMVDSLGKTVLERLPNVLQPLLLQVRSLDGISRYLDFVNQVIMKNKAEAFGMMHQLFLPLTQTIFRMLELQGETSVTGVVSVETELQREKGELRRRYYDLINCMMLHSLQDVLVTPEHQGQLEQILQALLSGVMNGSNASQKLCVGSLKRIVELWGSNEPFTTFIFNNVLPSVFQCMLAPSFDIEAGESRLLLASIASLQVTVARTFGARALSVLANTVLPHCGVPAAHVPEVAQQLCTLDEMALRKYLKELIKSLKGSVQR